MICPICNKVVVGKSYFSKPDGLGIQGMVYHSYIIKKDWFGKEYKQPTDRCFLTKVQYDNMLNEG